MSANEDEPYDALDAAEMGLGVIPDGKTGIAHRLHPITLTQRNQGEEAAPKIERRSALFSSHSSR